MIIRFSIENWMSYRDKVTFSMVASKEQQHGERISKIAKYSTRILPIAAVYGGNASGKTNLFKALNFAKSLVVKGTTLDGLIPVERFRLDEAGDDSPSSFGFELLIDEVIYDFSFVVTPQLILSEKLTLITGTREKVLYSRTNGEITFDKSLDRDQFLHFAFKGTRDNQLFLTNTVSQKIDVFRPVYNWFSDTLELIAPDSRFESFEKFLEEDSKLYINMNETLPQLDTGIAHLGSEEISFENLSMPDMLKTRVKEMLKEGKAIKVRSDSGSERFVFSMKDGKLTAKKLITFHPKSDGTEAKFEIRQESDGSQRLIDLLPAFLGLTSQSTPRVFVIDEVDRSLHTLLTRRLLETYLDSCTAETRSQLLFTTHDVLLMDQQLLRRDEMWITERDQSGASHLFSVSDYKNVRYDKDVRKSYLTGRFGGIPRILIGGALTEDCQKKASGGEG